MPLLRIRDTDTAQRARYVQAVGWLAPAGLIWGGLIGAMLGGMAGAFLGALFGVLVLGVGVGSLAAALTDRVGGMARVLYNPSGKSTPRRRDYSYAKSLVVRGSFEEAIEAYTSFVAQDPTDPGPYMAVARLLRDEMHKPKEAGEWLRRARTEATLDAGQAIVVSRELIELYRTKLGEPRRAAPELARLAEMFPETAEGRWAARELSEMKREMAEEGSAAPDVSAETSGDSGG